MSTRSGADKQTKWSASAYRDLWGKVTTWCYWPADPGWMRWPLHQTTGGIIIINVNHLYLCSTYVFFILFTCRKKTIIGINSLILSLLKYMQCIMCLPTDNSSKTMKTCAPQVAGYGKHSVLGSIAKLWSAYYSCWPMILELDSIDNVFKPHWCDQSFRVAAVSNQSKLGNRTWSVSMSKDLGLSHALNDLNSLLTLWRCTIKLLPYMPHQLALNSP